ncbi:MAG: hemolysin III family protein [Bacteroidota bacterium]
MKKDKYYAPGEERFNVLSHGIGFLLSIVALYLLVVRSWPMGDPLHMSSVVVFGLSLMVLYAASTLYHSAKGEKLRSRLKIFDHVAIYFLIAGSYTPFALITLPEDVGWIIFVIIWSCALVGSLIKLFFTGKYDLISTIMYVLMGWIIIFAIRPLTENLPFEGIQWLVAGGIAYTLGAVLYSLHKLKYNHAIFHVFVLVGSFCHFITVFWFVVPR